MAEFATIARPYAKALFGLAQEKTKLSLGWADWKNLRRLFRKGRWLH